MRLLAKKVFVGIDCRRLGSSADGGVIGIDAAPFGWEQIGDVPHDLVPDLVQLLPALPAVAGRLERAKGPADAHGHRCPAAPADRGEKVRHAIQADGQQRCAALRGNVGRPRARRAQNSSPAPTFRHDPHDPILRQHGGGRAYGVCGGPTTTDAIDPPHFGQNSHHRRGTHHLQPGQEIQRPWCDADDDRRVDKMKVVGNDEERARSRQVLPSFDPQATQDGQAQMDASAQEKADDPPPWIGKLRIMVTGLRIHDCSIMANLRIGKKRKPDLK